MPRGRPKKNSGTIELTPDQLQAMIDNAVAKAVSKTKVLPNQHPKTDRGPRISGVNEFDKLYNKLRLDKECPVELNYTKDKDGNLVRDVSPGYREPRPPSTVDVVCEGCNQPFNVSYSLLIPVDGGGSTYVCNSCASVGRRR